MTGIGAIGVILPLIVVVLFLLVRPRDGQSAKSASVTASSTSTTAPHRQVPPQHRGSTSLAHGVTAGITWSLDQSVALPSSSTAGPLTLDGDIATGYAHTPVGALIAAANISTRYFLALDSDYRQAAEAMIAPGVGRDAWIALRAKESHPTVDPAGTYAQIAGFNFLSYSLADSVVQVATRAADGSLQAVPEHVVWVNGDGGSCFHGRWSVHKCSASSKPCWVCVLRRVVPAQWCPRHRRGLSRGRELRSRSPRRLRRNRERLRNGLATVIKALMTF